MCSSSTSGCRGLISVESYKLGSDKRNENRLVLGTGLWRDIGARILLLPLRTKYFYFEWMWLELSWTTRLPDNGRHTCLLKRYDTMYWVLMF
jgi:hypothetical protein